MMLKNRPNSQGFLTNKPALLIVAPILPGKAEAWRRFMQEIGGTRRQEYEASRRRLGIRVERAWISETRQRTIGIMLIEGEALEQALAALAHSDQPFERWFREQLLTLQGLDLTQLDLAFLPDLIFAWSSDAE
jgi:hypothetical protein